MNVKDLAYGPLSGLLKNHTPPEAAGAKALGGGQANPLDALMEKAGFSRHHEAHPKLMDIVGKLLHKNPDPVGADDDE